MASTYKTPGVYVEEIRKFPPSVAQVETAIPAFIGYTERAEKDGVDYHALTDPTPIRITSELEYVEYFGKGVDETGITVTIRDNLDADANVIKRQVNAAIANPSAHNMYYAIQAFYANGGGPCYIVSVGDMASAAGVISDSLLTDGINVVRKEDEVTLFVLPEAAALTSLGGALAGVYQTAINQCVDLQDRFLIADVPIPANQSITDAASDFRNMTLPLDGLKYAAAYFPNVATIFNYQYAETGVNLVHDTVSSDGTFNAGAGAFDGNTMNDLAPDEADPTVGDAPLYNQAKAAIEGMELVLPPSSLIAGQYARVDNLRGVWKAPANEALSGVVKPTIKISNDEQADLNVTSSGKSINAIRTFKGKGTLIWGARTLSGNDNEWRYVSVRRFFNMVEESVKKASEPFVFEPNDANTWVRVRAMIENFLTLQWRAGALAGQVPEHAFFVRVGLPETMTALDILEGRMIVEIGMAVVRPAEFIILRFSHKMQES